LDDILRWGGFAAAHVRFDKYEARAALLLNQQMPILPLPQFEADLKAQLIEEDRKVYEALKAPRTIVARYGVMKMVGEFPYNGTDKPGCGSKLVIKTLRGTELGEMLTSTCPNSGCSKSVSRKEMLEYIQNSGGREYPFSTEGRILRIADVPDITRHQEVEQSRHALRLEAKAVAEGLGINIKIVEAEPILGGETLTFYYLSEDRVELNDLLGELRSHFRSHVELRHVGARDEARITADYERCGQYCCCKNFLKVLKPVSMKSAKMQKATLDPLKISGRCGRLMCCLRYEDQTYEDLKKNLPRKRSRVGTPDGDGIVIDGQILTQLVLVLLDRPGADGKSVQVAVPVENLSPAENAVAPPPPPPPVFNPTPPGYQGGSGGSAGTGGPSGRGGNVAGKPADGAGPRRGGESVNNKQSRPDRPSDRPPASSGEQARDGDPGSHRRETDDQRRQRNVSDGEETVTRPQDNISSRQGPRAVDGGGATGATFTPGAAPGGGAGSAPGRASRRPLGPNQPGPFRRRGGPGGGPSSPSPGGGNPTDPRGGRDDDRGSDPGGRPNNNPSSGPGGPPNRGPRRKPDGGRRRGGPGESRSGSDDGNQGGGQQPPRNP